MKSCLLQVFSAISTISLWVKTKSLSNDESLSRPTTLSTFTVEVGNWSKQADCSWGLDNKDGASLVVELGVSESAAQLAADAILEKSSGAVIGCARRAA